MEKQRHEQRHRQHVTLAQSVQHDQQLRDIAAVRHVQMFEREVRDVPVAHPSEVEHRVHPGEGTHKMGNFRHDSCPSSVHDVSFYGFTAPVPAASLGNGDVGCRAYAVPAGVLRPPGHDVPTVRRRATRVAARPVVMSVHLGLVLGASQAAPRDDPATAFPSRPVCAAQASV